MSLAFVENQVFIVQTLLYLKVEADNEARKGAFHFAQRQCQHNRQEGQGQGGGLEM